METADLERLRDTAVGLQRHPEVAVPPISLSSFVTDAVMAAVKEAEAGYMGGKRFPARPHRQLKTGPQPVQGEESDTDDDCAS